MNGEFVFRSNPIKTRKMRGARPNLKAGNRMKRREIGVGFCPASTIKVDHAISAGFNVGN
jgi:hypothetical protein